MTERPQTNPPPRWLLLLLVAAWIFPGLIGRDPWKADEAYSFGLVLNMVETSNWVVPTLGADPFLEKPPVFYITAASLARGCSSWLALHDGARLACALYMVLTLAFLAWGCRELIGPGQGLIAGVILLGCLGNLHTAHMLVTDNALLTGFAAGFCGLAIGWTRPVAGGLLCGTGIGLSFLSKGLLGPGIIGLAVVSLPLCSRRWRHTDYWRLLIATGVSASPWLLLWPWLLYRESPELFMTWFWDNNIGRFTGESLSRRPTTPWFYLKTLPWYGWPAFPLAAWTLWRERRAVGREPRLLIPALMLGITFLVLTLAGQRRSNYATPFLVPLAPLAVLSLAHLSRRWIRGISTTQFALFSVAAVLAWLAWSAQFTGLPPQIRTTLQQALPGYVPTFSAIAVAVAGLATLAWFALVFSRRLSNQWVVVHWTSGVALVYLLAMTLWLPAANHNMTFRHDFAGLREALGNSPVLVASRGVGEPERAMIHYYTGIRVACEEVRGETDADWILVHGLDKQGRAPKSPGDSWRVVWQGHHHEDLFWLYQRAS